MSVMFRSLLLVLVCTAQSAVADEFADATLNLCDKIRSCVMEEMQSQQVTPEIRQMLEPMMQGMCANILAKIQDVPSDHPLYDSALSCMRSMNGLTCDAMRNEELIQTPECKSYENQLKQYSS